MNPEKLIIGKIPFANLFPIFYALEQGADVSEYEFFDGVPAELNRKIREGQIDVSPSSSIEYLRNRDRYELIENHSISSSGPVGSILLFSSKPIEMLGGHTVLTSSQSETSAALIRIVLKKFYHLDCRFEISAEPLTDAILAESPYLLIGDEALREAGKWPGLRVYDLGDVWYRHTALPFTFALWIAHRDACYRKSVLYRRFIDDLNRAKAYAQGSLNSIAAAYPFKDLISQEDLLSYWKRISFDFTDSHRKGLELFSDYSRELGLI